MRTADDRRTARRVLITVGVLLLTLLALVLLYAARQVLVCALLAIFLAATLNPLADWTQRRVVRRRTLATLLTFLAALVVITAVTALIVVPLSRDVSRFAAHLPETVDEIRRGQGPLGSLFERIGVWRFTERHRDEIQQLGDRLRTPTVQVLRGTVHAVVGFVVVVVLSYLMVLQAPRILRSAEAMLAPARRPQARRIGRESAHAVYGYVSGNLLISVICGVLTFGVLTATGVRFAGVIALLVAVADLIPLIGATMGAVVAVGAGFLHSVRAGIVVIVFILVYQQLEDHLLQPVIMGRAVRLSPLTVLLSILIGAELAGIIGALLAIPVAGIIRVLLHEFRVAQRLSGDAGQPDAGPDPPCPAGPHPRPG
ncbi:AI-2E family transporter [Micromonosporaceae bacterium DT194]|uniref:AI-2E family transporter n=1 Tax=Melissospora conviva TaxID=3388432 RepID=UPI003C171537